MRLAIVNPPGLGKSVWNCKVWDVGRACNFNKVLGLSLGLPPHQDQGPTKCMGQEITQVFWGRIPAALRLRQR